MSERLSETIWTVTKNARDHIRVALDQWKGTDLVTLRQWAGSGDDAVATKSGFALAIGQAPALLEALTRAIQEARSRGLID